MIRFATDKDYEPLKDIWRACFGDDEAYMNLFFETRYQFDQTIVYEIDGLVVAMLHLLPMALQGKGHRYTGKYIYAVATLEKYRGRGISTDLLSFVDDYLQEKEIDCAVLVPATQTLFSFYNKKGYAPFSNMGYIKINRDTLLHTNEILTSCTSKLSELKQIRACFFGKSNSFIVWDNDTLSYLDKEIILTGGQVITVTNENGGIAYAVCYMENETLTIKEIVTNDLQMEAVIFYLFEFFSANHCNIQIKSDFFTKYPKKILPFSLIKCYNNEIAEQVSKTIPYMGLVSD